MQRPFDEYKSETKNRIKAVVEEMKTQPILFIGTGLSIRYFGAPRWGELLEEMSKSDAISRDYEYYEQTRENEREIAEDFSELYNEWAWDESEGGGKDVFPPWLFSGEAPEDIYLKYKIADHLRQLTPESLSSISSKNKEEIDLLKDIQPHAVITTNYDTFLEDLVFEDYERVIGQTLIEEPFANIGEIYKIHGCVTRPAEVILTNSDYNEFDKKKQYLSAKLLTFFTEHPVLIVGYRPNDPNVKRILSDVNSVLSDSGRQPNIFLVNWSDNIPERGNFDKQRLIDVGDGEQMIVNHIVADDFSWIFEAFSDDGEIKGVNSKLLRKLLKNTYEIVQEEAPRREVSVQELESVAEDKERLLDIFGISTTGSGQAQSDREPSTLAEAGVPVAEIISNDDVDDLNDILSVAVESWESHDVLIEQRQAIYPFYNQRRELNLSNKEIQFLFRSSVVSGIQGSEWLLRYEGEIEELLSDMIEILNGRNVATFERDLLVLGRSERLEEIADTSLANSSYSNAEEYAQMCDEPVGDRVKEYTGDSIYFQEEHFEIDELLSGNRSIVDLMDEIVETLISNDQGPIRRAFRNCELTRLANSPLVES